METTDIGSIDFMNLSSEEARNLGIGVMFHDEDDGSYKWIYGMDMMKEKSMMKIVLIVMNIVFIPILLLLFFLSLRDGFRLQEAMLFFGVYVVIMIICVLSTWFVNLMYKGSYMMLYQMNDEELAFAQVRDQAQITKMIASAHAAVSSAAGEAGGVISGTALTLAPNTTYTTFKKVRSIRANRKDHLIWVNSFMLFQMVYVTEEYYDFVLNYILERCKKAVYL